MLPLKISSFFDPPASRPPMVAPLRPRTPLADAPKLAPVEAVPPDRDRRVLADRRKQEDRREREQALFLDTRIGQSRRRTNGRRAEDQTERSSKLAISIKA